MRWIIYIAGWMLAMIALTPLTYIAMALTGGTAIVIQLLPLLGLVMRVVSWIRDGRLFLPASFSGWRFGITVAGVGIAVLAIGITLLLFWKVKGSGMSGVPAGIAIVGASVFALFGITATELSDWHRGRRMVAGARFDAARVTEDAESVMYQRLVDVLPECLVFTRVQMPAIVSASPSHSAVAMQDRVSHLLVDFVVYLKESSVIVAAVELQTNADLSPEGKRDSQRKEEALRAAGVPLLRWSALNLPDEPEIRAAFTR